MSSIQCLHVLGAEETAVNKTDKTYFLHDISERDRAHTQQTVLKREHRDEDRNIVKELYMGHPGVAS